MKTGRTLDTDLKDFQKQCLIDYKDPNFKELWDGPGNSDSKCYAKIVTMIENNSYDDTFNGLNTIVTPFLESLIQSIDKTEDWSDYTNSFDGVRQMLGREQYTATIGLAKDVLSKECVSYSRQHLAENSELSKFCGCYAYGIDLKDFHNEIPSSTISKTMDGKCDTQCTLAETVKKAKSLDKGETRNTFDLCERNVCIISDVKILNNASTTDLKFTQLCPHCPQGDCLCVIKAEEEEQLKNAVKITKFNRADFCSQDSVYAASKEKKAFSLTEMIQQTRTVEESDSGIFIVSLGGIFIIIIIVAVYFWRKRVRGRNVKK